jgi:hypothetical protein
MLDPNDPQSDLNQNLGVPGTTASTAMAPPATSVDAGMTTPIVAPQMTPQALQAQGTSAGQAAQASNPNKVAPPSGTLNPQVLKNAVAMQGAIATPLENVNAQGPNIQTPSVFNMVFGTSSNPTPNAGFQNIQVPTAPQAPPPMVSDRQAKKNIQPGDTAIAEFFRQYARKQ